MSAHEFIITDFELIYMYHELYCNGNSILYIRTFYAKPKQFRYYPAWVNIYIKLWYATDTAKSIEEYQLDNILLLR